MILEVILVDIFREYFDEDADEDFDEDVSYEDYEGFFEYLVYISFFLIVFWLKNHVFIVAVLF